MKTETQVIGLYTSALRITYLTIPQNYLQSFVLYASALRMNMLTVSAILLRPKIKALKARKTIARDAVPGNQQTSKSAESAKDTLRIMSLPRRWQQVCS